MSVLEALNVVIQVCRGLMYAHEHAIVHQDIKPGNIFLLPDGKVKLLDFGLACPCGSENLLTGTPYYMAPEQVECLPVDERADIFALGLTAFEMVCGRRPFEEADAFRAMNMHVEQDIPDPADVVPGLPGLLRDFILKACIRNPADRYRSAGAVLEALQPLEDQIGLRPGHSALKKRKLSTLFLMYRTGSQGRVEADWIHRRIRCVDDAGVETMNVDPPPSQTVLHTLTAFLQAVRNNSPMPITGEDACRAVEIAEACYRSAQAEGKPVTLPL